MKYIVVSLLLGIAPSAFAKDIEPWNIAAQRVEAQKQGWTFDVRESWVTDHLKGGGLLKDITGYVMPEGGTRGAKFVDVAVDEALPAAFDWRTEVAGGLQPIRNQKSCGSCWAFSVTAVLESLMMIKDPTAGVPDLAEQTLVSTCSRAGDCAGGYFNAFDYLQSPGMPNESQDPYRAVNSSCKSGLTRVGKVMDWAYIGNGNSSPTTEQMKSAIKQYGPISVTVNGSFGSYSSGIYNNCNSGVENHMVVLEGWNDDGQYWIMRNSWGPNWGEDGYMRIKYTGRNGGKCNNIGRTAAFAVLQQ